MMSLHILVITQHTVPDYSKMAIGTDKKEKKKMPIPI